MITQAAFMGGSYEPKLDANLVLTRGAKRLQIPFPQTASKDVTLPDARTLRTGGPWFYFVNGGEENAVIKDADGGTITTLTPRDMAILLLLDNTTLAGSWIVRTGTLQGYAGAFTDEFADVSNLTGPYVLGATNEAHSASGGILTLSGDNVVQGFIYSGNTGLYLPALGDWEVEAYITEITEVAGNMCGFGVYPALFAGGIDWFTTGKASIYFHYSTPSVLQAYYTGSSFAGSGDLGVVPSAGTPFTVKMTHTINGADHEIKAYYRIGASGGFTLFHTDSPSVASWLTSWNYKCEAGPLLRAVGASRVAKFDKIIYRVLGL